MGYPLWLIWMTILVVNYSGAGASMELTVGDSLGWRQPPANETSFYNQWASRNRFQVGDSIWFQYVNDSVLVVDKYDYYHCNSATPTAAYGDGNTTVRLEKPGPIYFISGNVSHCMNGERVVIRVMAIRPEFDSPPPSIAYPPESYGGAAPPPSSTSGSPAAAHVGYVLASLVVAIIIAVIAY